MSYRKKSALVIRVAVVLLSALVINGCSTKSQSELTSGDQNMQVWRVAAPTDDVFRAYKNHLEEKYSGNDFLWSGGLRVKGYFYGPDAELSIRIEGNMFLRETYLGIEISERGEETEVKIWHLNDRWRENTEEFRAMFPTEVVQAP